VESSKRLAFEGVLFAGGPGGRWACVKVPAFVPGLFGRWGRIAVAGTVNGVAFRAAIHAGADGGFFVVVPRAARVPAGVGTGDRVAITLEVAAAAVARPVPETPAAN
jgi:hypothetical protein